MRFGSVCSGIEAASVAFGPLGWKAAWLSEIEPFPCAVLAHHYQEVPNLGDMTTIRARIDSGEVEAPDVLCGGTPCQSFSIAGLRRSLDDARGNLSLEFIRIADAIDRVRRAAGQRPAYILWENVPGVLSTKDNAFGSFVGGLCGGDSAIDAPEDGWPDAGVVAGPSRVVAWRCLDAQFFGLAQRRKRVYVLALGGAGGWACADALLPIIDSLSGNPAPSREAGKVAPTIPSRSTGGGGLGTDFDCDGGLIPAVAMCHTRGGQQRLDAESETLIPTTGGVFDGAIPFDTTQITSAANRSNPQSGDPRRPLAAGAHAPAMGATNPTAVAVQASQSGVRLNETVGTLDANYGSRRCNGVMQTMQVRRLTPTECERLQGFPDGYAAIPWRGKHADQCPDGPRYKALGNSWAVPVVRWIGRRIDAVAEILERQEVAA